MLGLQRSQGCVLAKLVRLHAGNRKCLSSRINFKEIVLLAVLGVQNLKWYISIYFVSFHNTNFYVVCYKDNLSVR